MATSPPDELRLALISLGKDDTGLGEIDARLRGGRVTHFHTASLKQWLAEQRDAFDAAVICGAKKQLDRELRLLAKAGKHVLVDGPASDSSERLQATIAAFTANERRLIVAPALRYLPAVQTIQSTVTSGRLGEVGLIRIHRWHAPRRPRPALLSMIYADLDVTCWLAGAEVATVYAATQSNFVQVHLGFANGAMAIIDISEQLPRGDDYYSLSLIGSTGAAYADDHRNVQLAYTGGAPRGMRVASDRLARLAQIEDFLRLIQAPATNESLNAAALQALDAAQAVTQSLDTKQAIHLVGKPLAGAAT